MAWTEQCKIEAVNHIEHLMKLNGISQTKAIKETAKESGYSWHTLEKWVHPRNHNKETTAKKDGGNEQPTDKVGPSDAKSFVTMAISQLERIAEDDPEAVNELKRIYIWIEQKIKERTNNGKNYAV